MCCVKTNDITSEILAFYVYSSKCKDKCLGTVGDDNPGWYNYNVFRHSAIVYGS
jgi:hypothetical protein